MRSIPLAALLSMAAFSAQAVSLSYTGSLDVDNDVKLLRFVVGAASGVTLRTWSYAGGTMADGANIAAGGFDPSLFLFDSAGLLVAENGDGDAAVPPDPVTGERYDSYLSIASLATGIYTLAIAQYDNAPNGNDLFGGFSETDPYFTEGYGCSNGIFCDTEGANRTRYWALDIIGDEVSALPEVPLPATLPMALAGAGALGLAARRRRG